MIFFAPGTLVDPPLAPTVRGPGCPPAPPSDHWYGGLSGSLGDSEAWKPQKVGACGWTRRPRNSELRHVTQDTPCAWFRGVGAHCAGFWGFLAPFWAVSWTYRGVRGHQRSLGREKVKPHVECSSRLPSFGCFEPLLGLFWAKNGSLSECLFFFGAIFSAMERAQAAHVDAPVSAPRMRHLIDNKANDNTTDMNADGERNCPLRSMTMADNFTNEDQPRTTNTEDGTNSDYGHSDGKGGNAPQSHAHDEQDSSQAITGTKRDQHANQPRTNEAEDRKNSDYGHGEGGNAQQAHAQDEQASSQAITDTKRDQNAN